MIRGVKNAERVEEGRLQAAGLTRQIADFQPQTGGRNPSVVDVNALILNLENMLRPLLGEDINFRVVPDRARRASRPTRPDRAGDH